MFGIILERFIELLRGTLYPVKDEKVIAPVLLLGGDETINMKKIIETIDK